MPWPTNVPGERLRWSALVDGRGYSDSVQSVPGCRGRRASIQREHVDGRPEPQSARSFPGGAAIGNTLSPWAAATAWTSLDTVEKLVLGRRHRPPPPSRRHHRPPPATAATTSATATATTSAPLRLRHRRHLRHRHLRRRRHRRHRRRHRLRRHHRRRHRPHRPRCRVPRVIGLRLARPGRGSGHGAAESADSQGSLPARRPRRRPEPTGRLGPAGQLQGQPACRPPLTEHKTLEPRGAPSAPLSFYDSNWALPSLLRTNLPPPRGVLVSVGAGFATVTQEEGVTVTSGDVNGFTLAELRFPPGYVQEAFEPDSSYLALVLDGAMEKTFRRRSLSFGKGSALTMPAGTRHSARFGSRGARIVIVKPRRVGSSSLSSGSPSSGVAGSPGSPGGSPPSCAHRTKVRPWRRRASPSSCWPRRPEK